MKKFLNTVKNKVKWGRSAPIASSVSYEDPAESANPTSDPYQKTQWEALMRGQILSVTTQKLFNYIHVADQKAQMIIILNSIMIPVAMSVINTPEYIVGATISILTGMISILTCIICIYPKRRHGRKPDGTINHLHFSDIAMLKEHEYLESFQPIFNDKVRLTEEVVKDFHDVSRRVLKPKFRWLKLAYLSFFSGNLIAIIYTLAHTWLKVL